MRIASYSSRELLGRVAIVLSMVCFYLEAAVVRWATTSEIGLGTFYLVCSRFFIGFAFVSGVFVFQRRWPRPRGGRALWGRTLFNIYSVFGSYKAVELTTLAEGSILNMTYPLFIGIFSWIFFKEQRNFLALVMTVVAFCGIFLVLTPGEFHIQLNSLWGLTSGISAAISLICLNIARQENDTNTILWFVFGIGTVLLFVLFHHRLHVPTSEQLWYILIGSIVAIAGQYLLTMGFRYVTPVEGGILSSCRILIAAFLGPYITSDPAMTLSGWFGALLILGTNIYFILFKPTVSAQSECADLPTHTPGR